MLLASHYASWEWLITLNQKIGYHGVGVYKKLSNKYFDKLLEIFDQIYNTELVNTSKTIPIARNQNKGFFPFMVYPAINPKANRIFHWSFMVSKFQHTGPEMLAKDMT
jgi:KDO2-lipid IV(A) lauroyltransferase